MITDAQVHIWYPESPEKPWPKGDQRAEPHLPNGLPPDEFIAKMDEAGVDRAVIVPPSWIGEDNSPGIEAGYLYPTRYAVMGRFDPRLPDVTGRLEHWLEQPHMLGIRMTLFRGFASWLDDDTLNEFWAGCERFGIPVMALTPNTAAKLAPVAAKHPGLTLVMDHMSANLFAKGDDAFAEIGQLLSLAQYPNVYVKVSSAPCFSNDPYPFADIEKYMRQIYDSFGARRLMWGADYSRLTSTYPECLAHFRDGLDFLTAEDKEWILGRTLAEALKWPDGEPS